MSQGGNKQKDKSGSIQMLLRHVEPYRSILSSVVLLPSLLCARIADLGHPPYLVPFL